ncbi:sensor histidine kinase [Robertmurraya korlensis]|uniref:sensor histidine kinase n=1 Tax=Robertmurraya korlensis TaxID=519977 RepID=UPI0008253521|nr:HAMP domain-containing sensor histidine kinase [Robertmurraya korlensis]
MKELYTEINKKLYYFTIIVVIAIMLMGLLVDNPYYSQDGVAFFLHGLFLTIFAISLLLYPRYTSHNSRLLIMITAFLYFYSLFFIYPDTWSNFIFLCLIPAISILFFDSKLFYFSLTLNSISISMTFIYIILVDKGAHYSYIQDDLVGNIINFLGSQAIIYFIFYISYGRLKKQQLYFQQIKQSERLKTTGQLAAAVAHEIRNPLTVVKGFLQFYEQSNETDEKLKKHFHLMVDELNTAEQVISQFLSIAKPTKEKELESVSVKQVLQSVTDLLHSYGLLHDNQIELRIVDDSYIAANNIEMKQLFINIIKNAIEASNIGDSVVVSASKMKEFVEINVKDYGQGMTEKEIESLGTPFYSLKSKGTGLGMMICFNIAENYKGKISFKSAKGEGTTVTVRFPSLI